MKLQSLFDGQPIPVPEMRNAGVLESPTTPLSGPAWWMLMDGSRNSEAGVRVSPWTAMESAAVIGCIRLLADSCAQLPMRLYKTDPANPMHRTEARNHPVAQLIDVSPNPDMVPMTLYSVMVSQLCLWGNAYVEIQRDANGQPIALWPRLPHLTRVMRDDNGVKFFETSDSLDGKWRRIEADDMIHAIGLSVDGVVGLEAVRLARQEIGNDLAATIYSGRYFQNNGAPAITINLPENTVLKAEQKAQMRTAWMTLQSGPNQFMPAIMDQGATVNAINTHPAAADLVNVFRATAEKICWIYRVPPTLLGITDKAPRASAEQQASDFMRFSLGPILARIEQPMTARLAPTSAYTLRFDTRSLLRAAIQDRAQYYSTMRTAGILSANECRAMEDLPPIQGGDRYLEPANMNEVSESTNKEELDEEITDAQDTDY